jgi:uncharacterized membrane protein SirB2
MKVQIYQILHVVSMVFLTAVVFQSFANPDPKNKKRTGMITGILATLMLIGGFGLLAVMKIGFPGWILIKLACWFGLAGMGGMAYRKPEKIPLFTAITILLVVIAIATVYFFRYTASGSLE